MKLLPFVLSLIAGSADVISFLGLGRLFVAHVTGNLILTAAHIVTGTAVSFAQLLSVPVFILALGLTRLLVAGLAEDITERKKVDLQIQAALREKEALLRELFHRVKNNLQVVSSLLNLQSESLTDEQAREMFREGRHRIHSMALIHERLYQAKDLARIDIKQYVHDLASELFFAYGVSAERIRLAVDVNTDGAIIDIEKAVPLGLIINELLTNALKYAFPDGRAGEMTVRIEPAPGNMLKLTVADDGVGLPAGIDVNDPATLGLQLVSTLAEQLRGSLEARPQPGAAFTITFPKQ
jgi:two-component sensor histidine kinase